MKRFLVCVLSVVLAMGLMPAFALTADGRDVPSAAFGSSLEIPAVNLGAQAAPSASAANPDAVTGATAPADEASRDKVYVESFRNLDYSHYYGPAEGVHTDDAAIIETASKQAAGKTLVFEAGRTYTFGSYVNSRQYGDVFRYSRTQGIHFKTSNVVIEGNGATIQWDPEQTFTAWQGFVLEGTKEQPVHDVVIRNLNFKCTNNSWLYEDPIGGTPLRDYAMTQLLGLYCKDILIENCTFTAEPNPDPALYQKNCQEGFGVNCVWLRPASNVTVQNCTFRNVTKGSQESGGDLIVSGYPDYLRQSLTDEQRAAYNALDQQGQYEMIRDMDLKGRVENILVRNNEFEHACHDETLAMFSADVIKDVLIQDNTFNVHDGEAHVASNVIFTFAYDSHHDMLKNVNFTRNDVYAETAAMLFKCGADMGGDLHITDNNLHVKRVPRDKRRDRAADGIHYVFTDNGDADPGNGLVFAATARDYVDFSGNRLTYDNEGVGLTNLMGTKNVRCDGNSFIANGPLSYLALLYAADAEAVAGHETAFINNSFDINGELRKSLLRGNFRFTGNVVRLNGEVTGDALINMAGNFTGSSPRQNNPYVLRDDVVITDNKFFFGSALPAGMPALRVFDASFAGHKVDFTGNKFWSTVVQATGDWPLVLMQDVWGDAPTIDATGTESNLFNLLNFYRTATSDAGYTDYGATLINPKVLYGGQEYTASNDHRTRIPLATEEYDGEDPDGDVPSTIDDALYYKFAGNEEWTQGAGPLSVTFKRAYGDVATFGHFTGIKVDGADVDASQYDATAGSVIVSLHADYLAALAPGQHELQVMFDDGNDPSTTFTVVASQDAGDGGGSDDRGGDGSGSDDQGAGDGSGSNDQGAGSGNDSGSKGSADSAAGDQKPAAIGSDAGKDTQTGAGSADGKQTAKSTTNSASSTPKTGDPLAAAALLPLAFALASFATMLAAPFVRRHRR